MFLTFINWFYVKSKITFLFSKNIINSAGFFLFGDSFRCKFLYPLTATNQSAGSGKDIGGDHRSVAPYDFFLHYTWTSQPYIFFIGIFTLLYFFFTLRKSWKMYDAVNRVYTIYQFTAWLMVTLIYHYIFIMDYFALLGIIIYVGAIIVLFLFIIMMLGQDGATGRINFFALFFDFSRVSSYVTFINHFFTSLTVLGLVLSFFFISGLFFRFFFDILHDNFIFFDSVAKDVTWRRAQFPDPRGPREYVIIPDAEILEIYEQLICHLQIRRHKLLTLNTEFMDPAYTIDTDLLIDLRIPTIEECRALKITSILPPLPERPAPREFFFIDAILEDPSIFRAYCLYVQQDENGTLPEGTSVQDRFNHFFVYTYDPEALARLDKVVRHLPMCIEQFEDFQSYLYVVMMFINEELEKVTLPESVEEAWFFYFYTHGLTFSAPLSHFTRPEVMVQPKVFRDQIYLAGLYFYDKHFFIFLLLGLFLFVALVGVVILTFNLIHLVKTLQKTHFRVDLNSPFLSFDFGRSLFKWIGFGVLFFQLVALLLLPLMNSDYFSFWLFDIYYFIYGCGFDLTTFNFFFSYYFFSLSSFLAIGILMMTLVQMNLSYIPWLAGNWEIPRSGIYSVDTAFRSRYPFLSVFVGIWIDLKNYLPVMARFFREQYFPLAYMVEIRALVKTWLFWLVVLHVSFFLFFYILRFFYFPAPDVVYKWMLYFFFNLLFFYQNSLDVDDWSFFESVAFHEDVFFKPLNSPFANYYYSIIKSFYPTRLYPTPYIAGYLFEVTFFYLAVCLFVLIALWFAEIIAKYSTRLVALFLTFFTVTTTLFQFFIYLPIVFQTFLFFFLTSIFVILLPYFFLEEAHVFFKNFNISFEIGGEYYAHFQWYFDFFNLSLIFLVVVIFLLIFIYELRNISLSNFSDYCIKIFFLMLLQLTLFFFFTTNHLLLFYIFFEFSLIPVLLLMWQYGKRPRKLFAGYSFLVYTIVCSILFLLLIVRLYLSFGTFSIVELKHLCLTMSGDFQKFAWVVCFIAFAAKIPVAPLHSWLPEAHVEAPTTISVILAGILLKLGLYGLIKILLPFFAGLTFDFVTFALTLSVLSMLYATLASFYQIDVKKIIAYSSISHMSASVFSFFVGTFNSFLSTFIMIFSHGIVSSALFFLVGCIYDRYNTRIIKNYGGVTRILPRFSLFFLFFIFCNIGVPATPNFWSEFLLISSLYQVLDTLKSLLLFFFFIVLFLTAVYSLVAAVKILFGEIKEILHVYTDLIWAEYFLFIFLFIISLVF